MASLTFDSFFDDVFKGNVVPNTDTFYMMLVTSSYTPNQGTNTKRSDVTNEVSGTGYTSGGAAVTCTVQKDTGLHQNKLSFSNPSWASSTITARAGVIYKRRGGAASADELVAYADFGSNITSTNGTFTATQVDPLTVQN